MFVEGFQGQVQHRDVIDGHRITALPTNTAPDPVLGPAALELRHRQHALVEDRIREAKATGLRNLPCRVFTDNAAWLEVVLTAVDLLCWTKQICFADVDELIRCEIAAFRGPRTPRGCRVNEKLS